MELENKIKCVLMDFEINEITLQEATKRILLLLDVVGRSEQLVCPDCKGLEIYIDEYGGKPCQCTKATKF